MSNLKFNRIKFFDYFQIGILFLIVFFIPFIKINEVFLLYELPKILIFRILVEVLMVVTIIRKLVCKESKLLNFAKLIDKKLIILFILLVFWNLIVFVNAQNQITFIWGNYDKRFGVFTILHLVLLTILTIDILLHCRERFWEFFTELIPLSIFINFIICFRQLFLGDLDLSLTEGRVVGLFGQANFLAGFLLMLLPFQLYFCYSNTSKKTNQIYFLTLPISLVLIIWTGSRMGIVLYILTLFCWFGYLLLKGTKVNKKAVAALGAAFALIVFLLSNFSRFRLLGLLENSRKDIWMSSISLIKDFPIFGLGYDSSAYLLPLKMYERGISVPIALDRAHNEFLDIALWIGLPGLIIVIALNFRLMTLLYKSITQSIGTVESRRVFAVLVSIILFWLMGMVNNNGMWHYIFYFFLIGVAFVYLFQENEDSSTDDQFNEKSMNVVSNQVSTKLKLLTYRFFGVILLLIMSMFVLININELIGDYYYDKFYRTFDMSYLEKSINKSPNQDRYRVEYLEYQIRNNEKVVFSDIVPDQFLKQKLFQGEYYYRLARYYNSIGDNTKAVQYFEKAIYLEPLKVNYKDELNRID